MTASLQNLLAFVGRLLLASLFLPAGIGKATGFAGTVGYISSVGMPQPTVAAGIALSIEILGSLALVLGLGARSAALVLAFFTLVASFYFHAFWAVPADQYMAMQLLFNKNMAVVGGLLVLAAFGPGAWSVSSGRAHR